MMSLSSFGPFADVFAKGELEVPGYLELLSLHRTSAQIVIDRIECAMSHDDPCPWVHALFDDPNWRPHLVGAIALIVDDGRHLPVAGLWRAVDAGSWVTPQLVVTAYLVDSSFSDQCRLRFANSAPIAAPAGLSPIERHSATGPGGIRQRSAKLVASLAALGSRVPSMSTWLGQVGATPEIANLIADDVDDSGNIAKEWLTAVESQFALRGRALKPKVA
jgi:hypothetical protein